MYKIGISLFLGTLLATAGCRPATYIADEVPVGTEAETESQSDIGVDSASNPELPSDSDSTPDSAGETDTGSDSESVGPDCSGFSVTPGDFPRNVSVGGVERSYILHIPAAYEGPAALIFDYHALKQTGAYQLSTSIYPDAVDGDGVVTAFPDGLPGALGSAWNFGPCCVDGVDDLAFTMAMIDDIKQVVCIDPARIYAAGIYPGGGLAYYFACHAADVFAAVASSAFDLAEQTIVDCAPSRPITVVSFRTPGDPIMAWEGGTGIYFPEPLDFLGAEGTFDKWAELNGCAGPTSTDGNNCQYAAQCDDDAEVLLCIGEGTDTRGDGDIAWSILKRHTLPSR